MGYQISYGEMKKEVKKKGKTPFFQICCWFIAGMIVCLSLHPATNPRLAELVIPGDAEITGKAFEILAEDIQRGERIDDAVTAFCERILTGAELE